MRTRGRIRTDEFGMDSPDCGTTRYSGEQSKLLQVFFERRCKRLTVTSQSPCSRMSVVSKGWIGQPIYAQIRTLAFMPHFGTKSDFV